MAIADISAAEYVHQEHAWGMTTAALDASTKRAVLTPRQIALGNRLNPDRLWDIFGQVS